MDANVPTMNNKEPIRESIRMILHCPVCCVQHIDKDEFATKLHHTHKCQSCGKSWRPAFAPTVGVEIIPGIRKPPKQTKIRVNGGCPNYAPNGPGLDTKCDLECDKRNYGVCWEMQQNIPSGPIKGLRG